MHSAAEVLGEKCEKGVKSLLLPLEDKSDNNGTAETELLGHGAALQPPLGFQQYQRRTDLLAKKA